MPYTLYPSTVPTALDARDHGLAGWTFDPAQIQGGTLLPTAGLLQVVRIRTLATVVNNILIYVSIAGSGLTAGQCFAALYNDGGALLGGGAVTADQSTPWASTGLKTMALTVGQGVSQYAWYRVGLWYNGTTAPTVGRAAVTTGAALNPGMTAPTLRFSTADSGLTTTPPANIGAQTVAGNAWWVGLS